VGQGDLQDSLTWVKEVASVNFSVMTLGGTELKILQKRGSIE
jgi:hypothetical protein